MFKFFTDECVNTDVVLDLRQSGVDILTVREAGLTGTDDDVIFKSAFKNKRILLSFDRGFGDIFRFPIGKSEGVIVVLVGQMRKEEIVRIILTFLAVIKTAANFKGKLAILGKSRIRVIKR
ncbi:MAG: DUF5615 family PIN-like protein [Patescibacteria group bacterium]|nr:DUF5615 family PIN-like protein [Patescibacteria group bacterium]